MVSKVELVNIALDDMLGVNSIASLEEASSPARAAKRRVDGVIDAVLAMSDWTFARRIAALAEVENTDWTERYERKYMIPNDCVKALRLIPTVDISNVMPLPYSIIGRSLYTNEPAAKLLYTYQNTDIEHWPQPFAEAVAAYLARTLAMPLTRKRQIFADMNTIFQAQLATAIEQDAAQEQTFWTYPSTYLEARGVTGEPYDSYGADGSTYWTR